MTLKDLFSKAFINKAKFAESIAIAKGNFSNKINENNSKNRLTEEQQKNVIKQIKAIKKIIEDFLNHPEI